MGDDLPYESLPQSRLSLISTFVSDPSGGYRLFDEARLVGINASDLMTV